MACDPVQLEKALQVKGKWRKWSSYEIVNGVVVPAKGADVLPYDPWEAYRSNIGRYRTVEQPYSSLLELGRQLRDEEARGVLPSEFNSKQSPASPILGPQNEADRLVLDWCNKHGLLGLVPVLSNWIGVDDNIHHFREGGTWLTGFTEREERGSTILSSPRLESGDEDTVTPLVHRGSDGSMTWLNWVFHTYEKKPLAEMCAFFGACGATETFVPWRPGSGPFWEKYAEPIQKIAEWCTVFSAAADWLSRTKRGADDEHDFLKASLMVLTRLAESAAPRFQFYPTRKIVVDEERAPAGLLASYALMLLWDLIEERRALRCKNCDHYFVSDEYRAAYCSTRCRNTAQSRRSRAKRER